MTVAIGNQAEVGTDEIENCATLNRGEGGVSLPFTGDGNYQGTPVDESYTDPQDFQVGGNDIETEIAENSTGEASGVNIVGNVRAKDANCECGNH